MRKDKLVEEVISYFLLTLVGVLSQFVLTPLFIKSFGEDDYSRVFIIISICSFVLVSDYGIYQFVSSRLLFTFQNDNYFSIDLWKHYLITVTKLTLGIGLLLFLYFIYLTRSNPVLWEGFKFSWLIFVIFLSYTSMSLLNHAQLIKFQINNKFGLGLRYLAYLRLLEVAFQGFALFCKLEVITFSLIAFVLRIIISVTFWHLGKTSFQITKLKSKQKSPVHEFSLIKHSLGAAIFNFTNLLSLHGSMLIASLWITPELMFLLLIARMISSPVRYFTDSVVHGGLPRITSYFQKFDKALQIKDKNKMSWVWIIPLTIFFCFFSITIVILSPFLWTYLSFGNTEYPKALILFFLVAALLNSAATLYAMLGIARNQGTLVQYLFLVSTLISLGFQYGLRNILFVYSVPISIVIGDLIFIFFMSSFKIRKQLIK